MLGLYIKPALAPVQRTLLNNERKNKLPFNGKLAPFDGMPSVSLLEILEPYQYLYNIIHYHRQMIIGRNLGKIIIIPKGLISDDEEVSLSISLYKKEYFKASDTVLLIHSNS